VSSPRLPASTALFVLTILAGVAAAASMVELVAMGIAARQGPQRLAGLETAARLSPLNWAYRYELGALLARSGLAADAEPWFMQSLVLHPARAEAAIGLAEARATRGEDAYPWIAHAVKAGRSKTSIRVRAGTLYARLGDHERAANEFAAAALGQRSELRSFFGLLHSIYPDWFVLEKLVTDDVVPQYFTFAKSRLGTISMQRVWTRYAALGATEEAREAYVGYLLRHGLAHDAWKLAFGEEAPPVGTLINGNFEEHGDFSEFGWQLASNEGAKARVRDCLQCPDRGDALSIAFDGETNGHYFGVSQVVPVKPRGAYRLSAQVMADGITSARGPALAVAGLKGEEADVASRCELFVIGEELKRTFRWRPTSLIFGVPEACDGVRIMIARPRTRRLDKFIGGELWVDDVVLEEIGSIPEQASGYAADEGGTAAALPSLTGSALDAVKSEIRNPSVDQGARPLVEKLLSLGTDESDGARECVAEPWGSPLGGVGVAGHGVIVARSEQSLGAALRAPPPQPEQ
jgi:tetratricopeptide (TPR) repeat protein